ncbi:MAG TPA: glutathione S-transferase family protein [Casimicrobiaceae bacterium]|nr:glutathione S-transferase family protein [Casimicrobiaceae bacterium]
MYKLYIANKNYSSWSMRGWLCAKLSRAPFEEILAPFKSSGSNPAFREFAPNGLVPCLHDGDIVVWDSLAIAEYLAERHAGMWPADAKTRAFARSACAEMHAGFRTLRNEMTMCIRERVDVRPWSSGLETDIARVASLWSEGRRRFASSGEYLCGDFSIADAFFAPVAFRFQTYGVALDGAAGQYGRRLLAHPLVREWEDEALAETAIVEADEPRHVYRDKLRASSAST